MQVLGTYFDGLSSRKQEASLALIDGGQLVLRIGGEERVFSREAVTFSDPWQGASLIVSFAEGGKFVTDDRAGVDAFLAGRDRGAISVAGRMERKLAWVVGAVIGLVAIGLATILWIVPALAEPIARRIPPKLCAAIDAEAIKFMDAHLVRPSQLESARAGELEKLFRTLWSEEAGDQTRFTLFLRKGHLLGPNAFALPGGTVVMTDELVALAEDDRELQAVLAHEIGHVNLRHGLRLLIQSSAFSIFISVLLSDVSTFAAFSASLPTLLMENGYSREFERDADQYAVALLGQRGIGASHLATLLRRLDEATHHASGAIPSLLSTHPPVVERLQVLEGQGTP